MQRCARPTGSFHRQPALGETMHGSGPHSSEIASTWRSIKDASFALCEPCCALNSKESPDVC